MVRVVDESTSGVIEHATVVGAHMCLLEDVPLRLMKVRARETDTRVGILRNQCRERVADCELDHKVGVVRHPVHLSSHDCTGLCELDVDGGEARVATPWCSFSSGVDRVLLVSPLRLSQPSEARERSVGPSGTSDNRGCGSDREALQN
jgi:hypothetical protein